MHWYAEPSLFLVIIITYSRPSFSYINPYSSSVSFVCKELPPYTCTVAGMHEKLSNDTYGAIYIVQWTHEQVDRLVDRQIDGIFKDQLSLQ